MLRYFLFCRTYHTCGSPSAAVHVMDSHMGWQIDRTSSWNSSKNSSWKQMKMHEVYLVYCMHRVRGGHRHGHRWRKKSGEKRKKKKNETPTWNDRRASWPLCSAQIAAHFSHIAVNCWCDSNRGNWLLSSALPKTRGFFLIGTGKPGNRMTNIKAKNGETIHRSSKYMRRIYINNKAASCCRCSSTAVSTTTTT